MIDDTPSRLWQEIAARPDGPMAMRFYLQPLMSTVFAIKDGLEDARGGAPPYFWALFTGAADRRALIRDGWKSIGKIFLLAMILDVIYQFIELGGLRPVEGILVAVGVAVVPYLAIRGTVNRIARTFGGKSKAAARQPRS